MKQFNCRYFFDTETTNDENSEVAFPVLFTFYDRETDRVTFLRYEEDAVEYIIGAVKSNTEKVPVIGAYNLYFDLLPLLESLSSSFDVRVNAQTATRLYTLDLLDREGEIVLRFWDVSHLEPRGLKYMGSSCGCDKLTGWDYSKYRTPETPLTEEEKQYAEQDVRVISSYLDWINDSTPYITYPDFGKSVLTKTSLVRLYGKRVIGKIENSNGNKVYDMQLAECEREKPASYDAYATRKACNRGGLAFTGARYAGTPVARVFSLDACSMHHTFINGRYVPCKFEPIDTVGRHMVRREIERLQKSKPEDILDRYHLPFKVAFNVCIRVRNLKHKEGSLFERDHIGTLSDSKVFAAAIASELEEHKRTAEEDVMAEGYCDNILNGVFAFGKVMRADEAEIWITETETYVLCSAYDFELIEVIRGEYTTHFVLPPDFVTLQSCMLFEEKQKAKRELAENHSQESERYYQQIVKGRFNSIYGSQVLDVNKPAYSCDGGSILIDDATRKGDGAEMAPQGTVNYLYGMRISGGSRMHLVIAMQLLFDRFGSSVRFVGGDTDSIKIGSDDGIYPEDLLESLKPLHDATDEAIRRCQCRIRREYPEHASKLAGIGHFEVENEVPYFSMVEYWDKFRIYKDGSGFHLTAAGVTQPDNEYNLNNLLNDISKQGASDEEVYSVLGWNTYIFPSFSFSLASRKPDPTDTITIDGREIHQSIYLYETDMTLGSTACSNHEGNIRYLKEMFGRTPREEENCIYSDNFGIYVETPYTLLHKIIKS